MTVIFTPNRHKVSFESWSSHGLISFLWLTKSIVHSCMNSTSYIERISIDIYSYKISAVFNIQIHLDFEALYLGYVTFLKYRREMKLLPVLLVARKQTMTKRWLGQTPLTLDDWFGIALEIEIARMEELSVQLRTQQDKFYQICNK